MQAAFTLKGQSAQCKVTQLATSSSLVSLCLLRLSLHHCISLQPESQALGAVGWKGANSVRGSRWSSRLYQEKSIGKPIEN